MRYSKEFKLECITKYKNGEHIPDPGGCKRKTFYRKVLTWVNIYNSMGEVGLEHKKPKPTIEEKTNAINRVLNGETFCSVAISTGRDVSLISKWYKIYLQSGLDGLKSMSKRGRPTKMKNESTQKEKVLTKEEQFKKLQEENELLKIENEYLKKLAALVQKRKDQQQKKK